MARTNRALNVLGFTVALLAAAAVLYALYMWPAPKYFLSGIPYTAYNADKQEARVLVQGDHLQLLYHFGLARQMLVGDIPFFHNLYEFNLGEDSDRRIIDPYYIPYSVAFAGASFPLGDAFGWNTAQFLSIIVGLFFLYLVARRVADREDPESVVIGFCAAFIASCLPYLWVTLAGGSPTGFGMSLIPGVVLGVDIAVRDGKARGGALAGVLLLMCYATDLHCFFFIALSLPFWCIVSWCMSESWPKNGVRGYLKITLGLLPLVVCGVISIVIAKWLHSNYSATDVAGGRSLREVAANSPSAASLLDPFVPGLFSQHFSIGMGVFIIISACAIIMVAFLLLMLFSRYDRDRQSLGMWLSGLLIVIAIAGVVVLALGTNGPKDGVAIRALRKLVPPYSMIRQPVKIFCLLPTLIAVSYALAFRYLRRRVSHQGAMSACSILICCIVAFAGSSPMSAGVSILPQTNAAYAALVKHAAKSGEVPRALVVPIWPGDSAWSSLYEYHAIQNDLRMLNGYSPVKTSDYVEKVFQRFETVAHGQLDDSQLEALRGYGVTGIIFHEDAFPEQVAPFPAGVALRRLLTHPRLKLLAQDRAVWSFALLDQPRELQPEELKLSQPMFYAPSRWHHFEKDGVEGISPSSLPDGKLSANVWMPGSNLSNCVWIIRSKNGPLSLSAGPRDTAEPGRRCKAELDAGEDWSWFTIPSGDIGADRRTWVDVQGDSVVSDISFVMPESAQIPAASSGQHYLLPAVDLFHAGYTKRDAGGAFYGVCFEPVFESSGEILYGPNLPLPGGRGTLSIIAIGKGKWESADSSTYRVLLGGREVVSGKINEKLEFEYDGSSVLTIRMNYSAMFPICLRSFLISRTK